MDTEWLHVCNLHSKQSHQMTVIIVTWHVAVLPITVASQELTIITLNWITKCFSNYIDILSHSGSRITPSIKGLQSVCAYHAVWPANHGLGRYAAFHVNTHVFLLLPNLLNNLIPGIDRQPFGHVGRRMVDIGGKWPLLATYWWLDIRLSCKRRL